MEKTSVETNRIEGSGVDDVDRVNPVSQRDEPSLGGLIVEFTSIVFHRRRFLISFVGLITIASVVVALLSPRWYKATTTVFPAESAELPTGIEGFGLLSRGFSAARALTSFSGYPELDRYSVILQSSSVLSAVIRKFDLVRVYDITVYPEENTAKELLRNLEVNIEPEGNLTVSVYDKDPQRAADMANFFVSELNRVNSELLVQNARGNREFIEHRYKQNLEEIATAEDSLKAFQKRHGIIALPEQTEASIRAVSDLMGRIALKDVENAILEKRLSSDHLSVIESRIELRELHRKLNEFQTGFQQKQGEMNIFVPFKKYPDLGAEYVRRYRDLEIQYKILQFITPIYEQAKVEERRQTPSVLVLDKATPPVRKAKPRTTIYALLGFVVSTLVGLFVVFSFEGVSRLRTKYPEQFGVFSSALRSDWARLRFLVRRKRRI